MADADVAAQLDLGSGPSSCTTDVTLNSDKRGDLVAVRTDGKLFSSLSSGNGLKDAKQVGSGWNSMHSVL